MRVRSLGYGIEKRATKDVSCAAGQGCFGPCRCVLANREVMDLRVAGEILQATGDFGARAAERHTRSKRRSRAGTDRGKVLALPTHLQQQSRRYIL
jgi:hypothetical protein